MRILYLDLDTLRPDHLGCYGYNRPTSPNIDRIAAEGVRFDRYHCSDAPCLPSRAALMSGRFGIRTGVVGHGGTAADMRLEGASRGFRSRVSGEALPARLRRCGLKTVSISPFAERHSTWSFYAGFSEMHNTGMGGRESAEDVTPTALKWIEQNAGEDNWFLQLNYWDPHTPYRTPEEFGNPFADHPLPDWYTEEVLTAHRASAHPHGLREISMFDNRTDPKYPRHPGELKNMGDFRGMIDGYDCGIAYMDEHIGRIFEALGGQGVMDDLAIIISSDHGENLGELGVYADHSVADAVTTRIPMIVRWPGGVSGGVDEDLHYQLDLPPTLTELLGAEPAAGWDGETYAPAILRGESCGREYLVVSQCAHVCQRGVRFGPWMYIRSYHDGFHPFPTEMLFDVASDPHEQNDLASAHPDVCRQAVHYLNEWHDRMMKRLPEGYDTDPLWTVIKEGGPLHVRGRAREYCEYLKRTDRGSAAEDLRRRHPREFE